MSRIPAPLFRPADSAVLDDPNRDAWQKPGEIVRTLGLHSGSLVADVGAGSGYLLPYLSRAVGRGGCVFAEEIQTEFIPLLEEKAAELGNVTVIRGKAVDPALPRPVDAIVLLTVIHEVSEPVPLLRCLRRYLRPGGRLALIDFDARRGGYPPAPVGHEVPEASVIQEAQAAGWRLVRRHDFISSQFFLEFEPLTRNEP